MPSELMPDEATIRRKMSDIYLAQKSSPDGFSDWGEYTAHVVCLYCREIERLRKMLESHSIDPGGWNDPLEV